MAPMNCLSEERYCHSHYVVVSTSDDAITIEIPRLDHRRFQQILPKANARPGTMTQCCGQISLRLEWVHARKSEGKEI
jgi:hypothetical protein